MELGSGGAAGAMVAPCTSSYGLCGGGGSFLQLSPATKSKTVRKEKRRICFLFSLICFLKPMLAIREFPYCFCNSKECHYKNQEYLQWSELRQCRYSWFL